MMNTMMLRCNVERKKEVAIIRESVSLSTMSISIPRLTSAIGTPKDFYWKTFKIQMINNT